MTNPTPQEEKVARAIAKVHCAWMLETSRQPWIDRWWRNFVSKAKAAIQAMQESEA